MNQVVVSVIGKRDKPLSRKQGSIQKDPGHSTADSARILDPDLVRSASMKVGDLEAFPMSWNAGIDLKIGTPLP